MEKRNFKKTFVNRLTELEVYSDQYTMIQDDKNPDKYDIRVNKAKDKAGFLRLNIISHILLGMIYHFSNRKWITGHSYMYIMKSCHTITFNDGSVETE